MINAATPKSGGPPKGTGTAATAGLAVSLIVLRKLVPIFIGLIIWAITKNGFFGLAAFCGSGIFFWKVGGGWKTLLIGLTIFFIIIGIQEVRQGITQMSILYGKSIGLSLKGAWNSATSGISCSLCKASNPVNAAACEEKCDLGIVSTEQLLEITWETPGTVAQGMPISVDVKLKLKAKEESVKNLAVDVWIVNETDCTFDYCIPEEMYKCPKTSECVKTVEMTCGEDSSCYCQNNYCELDKDNDEKNVIVWLYNPTCHSKKDITLYPKMKTEYEFTAKTFHKINVAKSESEASEPVQEEGKSVGPLSLNMYSKGVFILEKMIDNLNTGNLKIKLTNTGEGYAYIKSISIKQEHAKGLGSFEITECPGFKVDKNGEDVELTLEEKKTFSLTPRDQSTIIDCIMNVPSEGITKFNEYTFSAYVTYQYKEERALSPVSLNCDLKS